MMCSRGESLTHHTNQMNQRRKYDHNVDIKSTQIADAGRTLAKGIKEFRTGCLQLGILLNLILWPALWGLSAYKDVVAKSKGVKPLVFWEMKRDYQTNKVRASDIWNNRYVTYSGKVGDISSSSLSVSSGDYRVSCLLGWFKGDQVKALNIGEKVRIKGKIDYIGSDKNFVILDNCSIQ